MESEFKEKVGTLPLQIVTFCNMEGLFQHLFFISIISWATVPLKLLEESEVGSTSVSSFVYIFQFFSLCLYNKEVQRSTVREKGESCLNAFCYEPSSLTGSSRFA